MTAQVPFNPVITTNGAGSFNVSSGGYIQGQAMDDPAIRNELVGGILADSETIPMWGGCGIYEFVANTQVGSYLGSFTSPAGALGGYYGRATALTGAKALTGFSVFDQNHAAVQTPQSPVPLIGSKMTGNFYRLGTGARIVVQCDPVLASLAGTTIINTPVAWDFVNQQLIPQVTSINVSSGTYNATTGLVTLTLASSAGLSPGDTVTVAGLTGTGSVAAANGTFTTGVGTTGVTVTYTIATTLTLTISNTGTVTTGAALAVKLLDIVVGSSMTVNYNATTGFATWNRSGNTALIVI